MFLCFSSTWHSGSWDTAHYWHGSYLVGGTMFSHVVSPVLKGVQAQDTHAVRCWLKVEHALGIMAHKVRTQPSLDVAAK